MKTLLEIFKNIPNKNPKIILILFFLIFFSAFLFIGPQPTLMGDGREYLGMTCSFFNHLTPDLRSEDINLRFDIVGKNNTIVYEENKYSGYFPSENGYFYSYHFWFYSLCSLPFFTALNLLNLNELRCFQILNLILLSLPLLFIVFHKKISVFTKFWFFTFALINPVLFYLNWSHPEVFCYTFVLLAILFYLNDNNKIAVFLSSIASLQNPPIIIFTLFLILLSWRKKDWKLKEFGWLLLSALITCLPFIFYYIHYNTPSLITYYQSASVSYISIDKILSLFLDLNYGIFTYLPILLIFDLVVFFISLRKKVFFAPSLLAVLILMGAIGSTQWSLNCGMMYIHRYAIYMIPILIWIAMSGISFFNKKTIIIIFSISLIVTGCITGIYLVQNDNWNYLKFNYLSKNAMIIYPETYNPNFEIFGERAIGAEENYDAFLPIIISYDGKIRKILTDEKNLDLIRNWGINITPTEEGTIHRFGKGYINMPPRLFYPPLNEKFIQIYSVNYTKSQKLPELSYRTYPTRNTIDRINKKIPSQGIIVISTSIEPELLIEGWAIDIENNAPASAVFVCIDEKYYQANYHLKRPDVADYFKNVNLNSTGFSLTLPSNIFSNGIYTITIYTVSSDKAAIYRPDKDYSIEITY